MYVLIILVCSDDSFNYFVRQHCRGVLLEYESQFINLLDQDLPGFEDEPENTKMSKSS